MINVSILARMTCNFSFVSCNCCSFSITAKRFTHTNRKKLDKDQLLQKNTHNNYLVDNNNKQNRKTFTIL